MSNASTPGRLAGSADADIDPSTDYRRDGRARIRRMRCHVREERKLVCELKTHCTAQSAQHLLKQALQTLDLVKDFFLSDEALRETKTPGQLSRWLDYTEECLQAAIKQREFYEGMLEKYNPTAMPVPGQRDVSGDVARRKSG